MTSTTSSTTTTAASSTWQLAPCSANSIEQQHLRVIEAGGDASFMRGFMLADLPLVLRCPPPPPSTASSQQPADGNDAPSQCTPSCELALEWDAQSPLRCDQLQLEITSSARHVELFIDGVRRSLLNEDEQGEVYLGTFRGTKQPVAAPTGGTGAVVAAPQRFTVSHEFHQHDAATNILKHTQRLRVKFVSLTSDKQTLYVDAFKCAVVPFAQQAAASHTLPPQAPPNPLSMASMAPALFAMASSLSTTTASSSAIGATAHVPAAPTDALDTHALLVSIQQQFERDVVHKVLRAVDTKLAAVTQRLAGTEQRLAQLHAHMTTTDHNVQQQLAHMQQQLAQLTMDATQQLLAPLASDSEVCDAVTTPVEAIEARDERT